MKKLLIIFTSIVISISTSYGEPTIEQYLPEDNVILVYSYGYYWPDYSADYSYVYYWFDGTKKNALGKEYRCLRRKYRYEEGDGRLSALLREEDGKVYMYASLSVIPFMDFDYLVEYPSSCISNEGYQYGYNDTVEKENVIYDYNLEVGDSIPYGQLGDVILIENVSYYTDDKGILRKKIETNKDFSDYVSGIGALNDGSLAFPHVETMIRPIMETGWRYPTFEKLIDMADIPSISGKEDHGIEYFTLQGVKVDNPGKGIYIRRCGDKTEKVVL